jgi:hypothetical protein
MAQTVPLWISMYDLLTVFLTDAGIIASGVALATHWTLRLMQDLVGVRDRRRQTSPEPSAE